MRKLVNKVHTVTIQLQTVTPRLSDPLSNTFRTLANLPEQLLCLFWG